MKLLQALQGALNFEGVQNPQFADRKGLGKVGLAGFLLGVLFGIGLTVVSYQLYANGLQPTIQLQVGVYFTALTFFHFMEFFSTALFKPDTVSYDSFIINHSEAYTVALLVAWAEYAIEAAFAPEHKPHAPTMACGLAMIAAGQWLRACAMWTCGPNFNHLIMERREREHQLVTHGVYAVCRHPSYCGWFWWSLGSQLLLCNPVCFLGYAAVSWEFFSKRIPHEEALLAEFYPNEYPEYAARTYIGIPFISNARLRAAARATADATLARMRSSSGGATNDSADCANGVSSSSKDT